jgi:hypothetical protein
VGGQLSRAMGTALGTSIPKLGSPQSSAKITLGTLELWSDDIPSIRMIIASGALYPAAAGATMVLTALRKDREDH